MGQDQRQFSLATFTVFVTKNATATMVTDITPDITTKVHFIMFIQISGYLFDLNVLCHRNSSSSVAVNR